jgi:HD-GYP domain-containing protein (c-di-GMP phosphodiesterase class II)
MVQYVDPTETRSHVNRVGAYAGEIFEKLTRDQGLPDEEVRRKKDLIRSAGILHDIGKIAIADVILKKPERLTEKETSMMKYHTYAGYNFFKNSKKELDTMCADITLSHHERWDGKGYPKNNKGDSIPLSARIVALADVYDAMISERIYRKPWKEYDVLSYIISQGGKQFDPQIVEIFGSIYGVINSIRQKYTDPVI